MSKQNPMVKPVNIKTDVRNEQKKLKIPVGTRMLIKRCISATLEHENFRENAEVSLCFVDDAQIKILNATYRDRDTATDVLSFSTYDNGRFDVNPENGYSILGDIVISLERAVHQAEVYGHSLRRELAFLVVHSALHLLGNDHEAGEKQRRSMRGKEEAILRLVGESR